MARRSYDQFCGLSRALDVVGERWTLLIVRELMPGPKRYSDLADALAGIGTSLLANRLKQLEADGLARRRVLPPPAASTVYELTDVGQELADAMVPLALWGARHHTADGRAATDHFHAEWSLQFLTRLLDDSRIGATTATYEFRVDDSAATLRIQEGRVHARPGRPEAGCDAIITTDAATMADIAGRRTDVRDALETGAATVEGDTDAMQLLLTLLITHLGAEHGK